MILLLPSQEHTLKDLEESIEKTSDLNALLNFGNRKVKVELSLPKFKLESQHDLNEPLQSLGMKDMFDSTKADFSVMTGGPKSLYVSEVVQKAFIEVNEDGAEAAAATAGIMMMRSMPMPPEEFRADRPFLFFLRDKLTGMLLFQGRLSDPSA